MDRKKAKYYLKKPLLSEKIRIKRGYLFLKN